MFEEDPRVLYISLHRLDLFPYKLDEADCNVVGAGKGAGYTVNVAWPKVILLFLNLTYNIKADFQFVAERNGGC